MATTVPFGEWRPDIATLDNEFVFDIENVVIGANSYMPFASLVPLATAVQSLASGGNDSYTKFLLHMDGADASTTFTDSNTGGSAHTWTAAGNAQIDTADSKFGGASGLFDGNGDYITTPDHADFTLGSGDWTFDCWFKCNVAGGTSQLLAGQCDNAASTASTSIVISRTTGNVIQAYAVVGTTASTVTGTTQFTNAVNTGWHHLIFQRTGNTIQLFIDNVQEGGNVAITGTVNDSASVWGIGTWGAIIAGTQAWNGWLDEARLSVGIARRISTSTIPTVAYYLGGTCVGLTAARTAAGGFKIFAGTATRLFTWTAAGWTDVSRTSGGNYNVASGDLWMWQQVGTFLYATNINDVLQRVDVDTGTNFAAVAGSPPQATHITQIGPHTVLSGLSSNRRKIQWSATEDPTGWTIGTGLSDEQEMPDGGPVVGVAGDEIGYVVQDRSIRLMQWLPGDTATIFSFSRVVQSRGSASKYGFLTVSGVLYFLSEDGFYALEGANLIPIGDNKVNDWFLANSDPARRNVVHAFSTAHAHRVYWAYHGSAASTTYDKLIIYDWALQKWSRATIAAQVWASLASTGLDLDTTGGEAGDALLDSSAASLDSYIYIGGRPSLGAVDPNGALSFQSGPNLQARLETAEYHLVPGMRAFVNRVYPLVDVASGSNVSIYWQSREQLQDGFDSFAAPQALEETGWQPVFSSARLHRFVVYIQSGSTWNHAQGLLVDAQPDGEA